MKLKRWLKKNSNCSVVREKFKEELMATPILMPQIGQDITVGRIVKWFVKENDEVKEGDIIAEVESEKAIFEVESYESGIILKILYNEGDEVEILKPIAYLGKIGEKNEGNYF